MKIEIGNYYNSTTRTLFREKMYIFNKTVQDKVYKNIKSMMITIIQIKNYSLLRCLINEFIQVDN